MAGKVALVSSTLPAAVLESCKALVQAYFPEAWIAVDNLSREEYQFSGAEYLRPDDASTCLNYGMGPDGREQPEYCLRIDAEPSVPATSGTALSRDKKAPQDNGLPSGLRADWLQDRDGAGYILKQRIFCTKAEISKIREQPQPGREEPLKTLVKHAVLRLLTEVCGRQLPWGILTGIRPTKLLHRLTDMGLNRPAQSRVLQDRYAVRPDKVELVLDIARVQEPHLQRMANNPQWVAVYAGIPFCPSRCSYCSFPGYLLSQGRHELTTYLQVLKEEMKAAAAMLRRFGLEADSIYVGGGTPTILTTAELAEFIGTMREVLPTSADCEFTVEAGRPDTLSEDKLRLLVRAGVNRLSINPQTMQEATLRRIGRVHSVKSVVDAYCLARSLADWVINMDLILGLPGEGVAEVRHTLESLAGLQPANLTVHALALKRGSREREIGFRRVEPETAEEMLALTRGAARDWNLRPYYLYRQKQISGNLENTGYARPGTECRYNIAIMEERQTVIGLGAGASTKVVDRRDYSLTNLQHPGNWLAYASRWQEVARRREQLIFESVETTSMPPGAPSEDEKGPAKPFKVRKQACTPTSDF